MAISNELREAISNVFNPWISTKEKLPPQELEGVVDQNGRTCFFGKNIW